MNQSTSPTLQRPPANLPGLLRTAFISLGVALGVVAIEFAIWAPHFKAVFHSMVSNNDPKAFQSAVRGLVSPLILFPASIGAVAAGVFGVSTLLLICRSMARSTKN